MVKRPISEAKLPGFQSCLTHFLAVTLCHLLYATVPWFSHLKNGGNNSIYFTVLLSYINNCPQLLRVFLEPDPLLSVLRYLILSQLPEIEILVLVLQTNELGFQEV